MRNAVRIRIGNITPEGLDDSEAGDVSSLEALYVASGPFNDGTGWAASGMDLSQPIAGVYVDEFPDGQGGTELRVVEIDMRRTLTLIETGGTVTALAANGSKKVIYDTNANWTADQHNQLSYPSQGYRFIRFTSGPAALRQDRVIDDTLTDRIIVDYDWDVMPEIGDSYEIWQASSSQNMTGNINIAELANLQKMKIFCVYHNNLDTEYPTALHQCESLESIYLSMAEDGSSTPFRYYPHQVLRFGRGDWDYGKTKFMEGNVISGDVPSDIQNLPLKHFVLDWTDYWTNIALGASPNERRGISSIPSTIWNIEEMVALSISENWNIPDDSFSLPSTVTQMPNLELIQIGCGSGSGYTLGGYLTGTIPSDINQLQNFRVLSFQRQQSVVVDPLPDFSLSQQLAVYSFNGLNFRNDTFPAWLVDGTLDQSGNETWGQLDSINLGFPTNRDDSGDIFTHVPGGIGEGIVGGADITGVVFNIPFVDLFDVQYNNISGALHPSFFQQGINKFTWKNTIITSLGLKDGYMWNGESVPPDDATRLNRTGGNTTTVAKWPYAEIGPENIPYVDWGGEVMREVLMQGNYYTFENLLYVPENAPSGETCLELWLDFMSSDIFTYAPQRRFGQDLGGNLSVNEGTTNVEIDAFANLLSHPDNVYQWWDVTNNRAFQNSDAEISSGATTDGLVISEITPSWDGRIIELRVTNSLEAGYTGSQNLELLSEQIIINIQE